MRRISVRITSDRRGHDVMEYALLIGFVAVAIGAIMPNVSSNIEKVFDKIGCSSPIRENRQRVSYDACLDRAKASNKELYKK